ncbi:MAG: ribosome biogenesis GTPase Der [Thermoguttaceae bacterium]
MSCPQVAIVGRPNVGKSSLFNWLIGQRVSIVDPTAGVTRDRVTFLLDLAPDTPQAVSQREERRMSDNDEPFETTKYIELVDTGGIGIVDDDDLSDHVEAQIHFAIERASLVLFVVDSKEGITPLDAVVADRLRKMTCPILLVANKCDCENDERNAQEFHALGWDVITVSAKQKRGRVNLMEEVEKTLDATCGFDAVEPEDAVMKVAIVGRRNVGKSTFINSLAREDRVIVSPIPGTTRDSIDVRFEMDGKTFVAIDTPGFQRRREGKSNVEFYSTVRGEQSIQRADVVLLFFDASQRVSQLDKKLANFIEQAMKPCIFVVNKWDLMAKESMPTEEWGEYLREQFPGLAYVPIAFVTGLVGKNIHRVMSHAMMLFKQSRARVSTPELNKLVAAALDHNPPPLHYHHRPKVYYATQVTTQPPTIVLFSNMPDAFSQPYHRYLLGILRDELPFGEVPIRLVFRKRGSDDSNETIEKKRKT